MRERLADLHIHSTFSDGLWDVRTIFIKAKERGLSTISITDHDTVAGIEEAIKISKEMEMEFIPGVEISSYYKQRDVHILGYFINWENSAFVKKLDKMRKIREKRAKIIIEKLKELGMDIPYSRVLEVAGKSPVARPHIAHVMVEKGYVSSVEESFEKYIGDNGPAYYPKILYTPSDVISMIKKYRGISILAHPGRLPEEMVKEIIDMGVDGIEVFYPEHTEETVERLKKLARDRGLLITGGSDCHGGLKGKEYLGEVKLDYVYVEEMKKYVSSCCIFPV